MSEVVIKKATVAEVPIISLLGRVTFGETFGQDFRDRQDLLDYFEKTFSVAKIRSSLQQSDNVFWVAYVNELPVGYAKLKVDSPSDFISEQAVAQLQKIYVLRDFHAFKVGYLLQETLLQHARTAGCAHIWLSVLDRNEKAQRFYHRTGFSRVGQHAYSIGKEDFDFFVLAMSLA